MSRLSDISASPILREYAQGAAQSATQPVADFLAPAVNVGTSVGRFKVYTEKNRFRVPDTLRALGGKATRIGFGAGDATYNCEPHALDAALDNLEKLETADIENIMKESADMVAEVAGLSHEQRVINAALTALGAGTDTTWNDAADPIDIIDGHILNVIKAAKYGSLMGVGMLFGPSAFRIFKNHSKVRGRFIVGNSKRSNTQAISIDDISTLFMGKPESKLSMMVYDDAPEGKTEDIEFLLDDELLIFARKANPSRRDPSFMKTFRLNGQWMVPGTYETEDGRGEVAKLDWSEDVQVSNASAAIRLNVAAA